MAATMSAPVTCRYGDTVAGCDLENLRTVVHGLGGGYLRGSSAAPAPRSSIAQIQGGRRGDGRWGDALLELAKASGTKSGPFLSVGGNLAASSRLGSFLSREVASRGREEAEETLGKSSILAERCPHPIPLSFSVCFSMDNIATDRSTIQALGRRILMLACPLKDCRIPTLVSNMVYTDDDVTLVDVPCSLLQEQRRRNIQFSMWI
ncbi:uncharacterized protein LOC119294646 isoform X2 [Triticum dicoccoides]|uniref:uncharacterized protein LOC119294646 isoform X2 n=1 Tax=Triticum dicoccoides TaxID=85692 RepID=UPI0018900EDE|nr:uncharacterized protein LOC119294646 isoform X2 [Triticum dicoccoides]